MMTHGLTPNSDQGLVEGLPFNGDDDVDEPANREERALDPSLVADVPSGLIEFVRSLCRTNWMAERILLRAADKVLRRLRFQPDEASNAAARKARWASRWLPENRGSTMKWLGQIRDEVVRRHHLENVSCHDTFATLPRHLQPWNPKADGTLAIDEPKAVNPSFGSNAYLEQTPIKLLRWIHETWRTQQLREVRAVGLDWSLKPKIWDLTAGSKTSVDYFERLHECDLIASDLTVIGEGVFPCDARDFNTLHARRLRRRGDPCYSTVVVPTPDIVLFDPPSRGLPLHAQIYGEDDDTRDIAFLERDDWISTVADIAIRVTAYLADEGFVSLLLRCGFRLHDDAVADSDLLDDFKATVQGKVLITHEMPLAYRALRNQTSLGTARVPAVHLVLRKAP